MRKLDARDCHRCGLDGLEPAHRPTAGLDRSDPPEDRTRCDTDTALEHHCGEVAVRQVVGHVPPHAQDDDLLVEVAALEHRMAATTNHGDLRLGGSRVYPAADATEPARPRELKFTFDSRSRSRSVSRPHDRWDLPRT